MPNKKRRVRGGLARVEGGEVTNKGRGPRPCRDDTRGDQAGFDTPGRAVEFVCAFGREAGVSSLNGGQSQHERAEEKTDACVCASPATCIKDVMEAHAPTTVHATHIQPRIGIKMEKNIPTP